MKLTVQIVLRPEAAGQHADSIVLAAPCPVLIVPMSTTQTPP
jgi:hypothetical protein